MSSEKDLQASLEDADLVAIITDHQKYDYNMIGEKANLIFDARNAMKNVPKSSMKVIKL